MLLCQNTGTYAHFVIASTLDLVQYRILFCIAIDDCRKELWETNIQLQGHSTFNHMRCSDLSTQCNYTVADPGFDLRGGGRKK